MINRQHYPQLDLLLWDSQANEIAEPDAFVIYEKRWRYVEQADLTEQERQLIKRLTALFGNGIFLTNE